MEAKETLTIIIQAASDIKAKNLLVVDLANNSSLSDYIVICSGTSTAHNRGISDRIGMEMKKTHQLLPLGIEGETEGEWILMDYNDVIVHIFTQENRELYQLEEIYQGYQFQWLEVEED